MTADSRPHRLILAARAVILGLAVAALPGCDYFASPEAQLARARADLAGGNAPAAAADARKVLERDPRRSAAWLLLADAALLQSDLTTADNAVDKARNTGARAADVAVRQWAVYRLRGDTVNLLKATSATDTGVPEAVRARYQGHALLADKRLDEALAAYQKAAQLAPDDAEAVVGIASIQLAQDRTETGLKTLRDARTAHPQEVRYPLALGQAFLALGRAADAAPLFTEAAHRVSPQSDTPSWVQAQAGIAQAALAQGQTAEAKAAVRDLKNAAPNLVLTKVLQARVAVAEGRLGDAAQLAQTVVNAMPGDLQGHMLFAYASSQQGYTQQAETSLNAVLQEHPDFAPARKLLADIQLNTRRLDAALRTLEPLLGADADPEVLILAGRTADGQGRARDADVYYSRALASTGITDDLRYRIATLYLRAGKTDRAADILKQLPGGSELARKRDLLLALTAPESAGGKTGSEALDDVAARYASDLTVQRTVAQLHASRGDTEAARTQLNQILKDHPGDVDTLLALAGVEASTRHYEAAEAALRRVLSASPKNVAAAMGLARLAAERGDNDAAVKQLETVRAMDPKALEPRLALARFYLIKSNEKGAAPELLAQAQAPLKEALALAPKQPDVVLLAAELERRQGRVDEARQLLKDAATTAPASAPLWLELARLNAVAKDLPKAYESLGQALAARPGWLPAVQLGAELRLSEGQPDRAFETIRRAREVPGQSPAEALNQRHGTLLLEAEVHVLLATRDAKGAPQHWADAAQNLALAYALVPSYSTAVRAVQVRTTGHLAEPEALLVNWLKAHPQDGNARGTLAAYYGSTGNRTRAIETYEAGAKQGTLTALQLNNLAWLYYETHDNRALATAQQALELSGRQPDVLDTLGWILVQQAKLPEGLPYLEEAARGNNRSPEIAYHLAYALAHSGRPAEAKTLLANLLATPTPFASRHEAEALQAGLRAAGN